MARKPVIRNLPALSGVLPAFKGFSPEDHRGKIIQEDLRRAIANLQARDHKVFYGAREVAEFYGVCIRTVTVCYKQLESEGLLSCKRGAFTRILGDQHSTSVRGIVAIPVFLKGFLEFPEWREFFIDLEERIRRINFVAVFLFFKGGDLAHDDLWHRIRDHRADVVVWLSPPSSASDILLRVKDQGIRLMVVGMKHERLPGQCYQLDFHPSLDAAQSDLMAEGIKRFLVLDFNESDRHLNQWIKTSKMEMQRIRLEPTAGPECLDRIGTDYDQAAIFISSPVVMYHLSQKMPEALLDLACRCRLIVAFRVESNFPGFDQARVGVLDANWTGISAGIANRLHCPETFDITGPQKWIAKWIRDMPLKYGRSENATFSPRAVHDAPS